MSLLFLIPLLISPAFAVEVAPRISDREIIEGLADIRGDIKKLEAEVKGDIKELRAEIKRLEAEVKGDIKELRAEIKRLEAGQNALKSEMKANAEAVDKRFDDLRWMLSLFITIALVILGFVLRMQWQMHRKQTQVETTLEIQKDELAFLKTLIEKLLPPKGVL
jgi:chromosome segregation ATPase